MRKQSRKLSLNHETIRTLDSRELARPRGGVVNYDTSINHRGCSGPTIKDTCYTVYGANTCTVA